MAQQQKKVELEQNIVEYLDSTHGVTQVQRFTAEKMIEKNKKLTAKGWKEELNKLGII